MAEISLQHLKYIKENFPSNICLTIVTITLLILFSTLDDFIGKIIYQTNNRFQIYGLILVIFWSCWLFSRYFIPRTKKGKIGLVICIKTENDKQKIRLKNDFSESLERLIRENDLNDSIDVILLSQHHAEHIVNVLEKYGDLIKRSIKSGDRLDESLVEIKKWKGFQKRIRGHFFIYGKIAERKQGGENHYRFEIDSMVTHKPVELDMHRKINHEFNSVWFRRILFAEKDEMAGFAITAELVYLATKYMTGMAAFVSGDPFTAIKLHESLVEDFNKIEPLPHKFRETKSQTLKMIATELTYIARWHYFKKNLEEANKYLEKALGMNQKNPSALILKSILLFNDGNPKEALKLTHEAGKRTDGPAILYNKGFLLMSMQLFHEALKVYDKLSETDYEGEEVVWREVYEFNTEYLKSKSEELYPLFILGYIKKKKEKNYPEALHYFEEFIKRATDKEKLGVLVERAKIYKKKLEKKMGLSQQ